MTEQKEFESLDDLFRKTFDNLPETPAKSGWDTPSEQVWQHVQKQIKPPQSGWSTQTLMLIAAFAVTLAVGLYFLLNRPVAPETPTAVPPPAVTAESPEQPASNDAREQLSATIPVAPESSVLPAKTAKQKSSAAEKPQPANSTELKKEAEQIRADSSHQKPAAQQKKVPNTTLRLKAELAKRAEEAWDKPLDTLPQRWPGKSKN